MAVTAREEILMAAAAAVALYYLMHQGAKGRKNPKLFGRGPGSAKTIDQGGEHTGGGMMRTSWKYHPPKTRMPTFHTETVAQVEQAQADYFTNWSQQAILDGQAIAQAAEDAQLVVDAEEMDPPWTDQEVADYNASINSGGGSMAAGGSSADAEAAAINSSGSSGLPTVAQATGGGGGVAAGGGAAAAAAAAIITVQATAPLFDPAAMGQAASLFDTVPAQTEKQKQLAKARARRTEQLAAFRKREAEEKEERRQQKLARQQLKASMVLINPMPDYLYAIPPGGLPTWGRNPRGDFMGSFFSDRPPKG